MGKKDKTMEGDKLGRGGGATVASALVRHNALAAGLGPSGKFGAPADEVG